MLYKTFEEFSKNKPGGRKALEFENRYGISAVYIDGAWEIAVLKDGSLCYDTPITDDVIPGLEWDDVLDLALDIALLPLAFSPNRNEDGETDGPLLDIGVDV
mgnify:CR=1 FL=1|tara:strand:- start:667 stop:972 length:306 start_codon:yes stop_codon:yes gene_type:complete